MSSIDQLDKKSSMTNIFVNRRCLCVITGASRGFGRACVETLAEAMHLSSPGSGLLLISRNEAALSESRQLAMNEHAELNVVTCPLDLLNLDNNLVTSILETVLKERFPDVSSYDTLVLIHNAGTLGDISKRAVQHRNFEHVDKEVTLNLTSPIILTAIFNDLLFNQMSADSVKVIVNISSLAAVKPFECWSLYCANKAARDMFFKCLALESPTIRVLNYAPGPLDTDMQEEIRIQCGDEKIRAMFVKLMEEKQLIRPVDSAKKMIDILCQHESWNSGDHVDYYDVINNAVTQLN